MHDAISSATVCKDSSPKCVTCNDKLSTCSYDASLNVVFKHDKTIVTNHYKVSKAKYKIVYSWYDGNITLASFSDIAQ